MCGIWEDKYKSSFTVWATPFLYRYFINPVISGSIVQCYNDQLHEPDDLLPELVHPQDAEDGGAAQHYELEHNGGHLCVVERGGEQGYIHSYYLNCMKINLVDKKFKCLQ